MVWQFMTHNNHPKRTLFTVILGFFLLAVFSAFVLYGFWSLPSRKPARAPEPQSHWHTVTIHPGDTPIQVFHRLGLKTETLHQLLLLQHTQILKNPTPGKVFHFLITTDHQLLKLWIPISATDALHIDRVNAGYRVHPVHREYEKALRYAHVCITQTLSQGASKAGLDDAMIMALANIFEWDIDFNKDLRRGDAFSLLYETHHLDGKKMGNGPIIYASFTNRGHTYRAIRYTHAQGESHYYTPEGISVQRPFLRTPVKYTHISSRFSLGRLHPILHHIRAHKGVDYAAPRGTPIRATGDGKIIFIGRKGGYGKVIIIQHNAHYSTLYGHMQGFAQGLHRFSRVKQDQVIGTVGQTGLATGPHLHYEFRINGIHRDPLTIKLPKPYPIAASEKASFLAHAQKIMAQVQAYASLAQ